MATDTEIDNDPTGMYAMARQTHASAVRNGAIKGRIERLDQPHPVFAVLDDAFSDITAEPEAPTRTNGWVPTVPPEVSRKAISITELDAAPPPSAAVVFPSFENRDPIDQIRSLWPDGDSPVYEEVDAEVTWPKTPTGRKAKRGPKLPWTDGLPFEEYSEAVKADFRRVRLEMRVLRVTLDEQSRP